MAFHSSNNKPHNKTHTCNHVDTMKPCHHKINTEKYLNIFKDYPYVFNLGHGVLPEIKPETIEYIIQLVRNKK